MALKLKGVNYDVGSVMGGNWRPDYNPKTVHRELEIIKNDLHCNALGITGLDIRRLIDTAADALDQGFTVWLTPCLWNKSPAETLDYKIKAAVEANKLIEKWSDRLVFSVGGELTLFMQGIVEGSDVMTRIKSAFAGKDKGKEHRNKLLNEYLDKTVKETRKVFHGQISYNSLIWEEVNWENFDYIGIDHYWAEQIKDRYIEMLRPHLSSGKPVVVTSFGFTTTNAPANGVASTLGNVNWQSKFLHQLPIIGRFVKPYLNVVNERDEHAQASRLVDTLKLLDGGGVYGAFIDNFVFPLNPYDDNPKYDLDRESESLVKSYGNGKHGATYPEMTWEPKESFKAVADYYAKK